MNKLLLTALLLLTTTQAMAFSWEDLWLRPDQQGEKAMNAGNAKQAATLFRSSKWQGVANYRSGDYQSAANDFAKDTSATGYYNQGNAFAQMGDYQKAINAYKQALAKNPKMADAKYNKDLIEQLQKQQSKQNNNQDQSNQDQQKQKQQQQSKQNQQNGQNQQSKNDTQQQNSQSPEQSQNAQAQQAQNQQGQGKPAKATQAVNEQQQATDQWLRGIPDDPGGLLQQKFLRDHQNYQALQQQGKQPW